MLISVGFAGVSVEIKPESRAVIAQWMPGSGAEDYVVSANVKAVKPRGAAGAAAPRPPAPAAPTPPADG